MDRLKIKFSLVWVYTALAVFATVLGIEAEESALRELSQEDCVRYAISNSFEVKLAKLDLLIAETEKLYSEAVFDTILFGDIGYSEDKRQPVSVFSGDNRQTNTYSAGVRKEFFSGTELTVSWSDQRDWVNSPFVTTNPSHNAQLTFDVTQPVLKNAFGFIDRGNLTLTSLAIKNADLDTLERIETIASEVEKEYWTSVFRKVILRINKDMLEKARVLHEVNQKNYKLGLLEKPDILASEANVLMREKDVILAEEEYKRSRENLKFRMNISEDEELFPDAEFSEQPQEFDLAQSLKTAFEKNRVYWKMKREVEMSDIKLKMKGNELWPELDLAATFAMNGLECDFSKAAGKTTVADNTYYYAGAKFTFPLENSFARGEYDKAAYGKEKAIVALKREERSIITRIGNAHRAVMALDRAVLKVVGAVSLQAEKLSEEEKRFSSGRSRTKTLIDYQTDLLNAEMARARELFARETARINMEKEMNVLLEKYEDLL
jgi:outer membrane protein TolC